MDCNSRRGRYPIYGKTLSLLALRLPTVSVLVHTITWNLLISVSTHRGEKVEELPSFDLFNR